MPAKSNRTSGGNACNLTGDGSNDKTFDAKTPRREEKQNPGVLRLHATHPNRFPALGVPAYLFIPRPSLQPHCRQQSSCRFGRRLG